jgi:hypothetical protein
VERANAEILRGLKTRTYDCLKKHGANWVSELPSVLWGEPDHAQLSHRGDPILPGLWSRSLPSPRNHYGLPMGLVV